MTINKAQGRSFKKADLYINQNNPSFGHSLSRAKSCQGIKIQITGAKDTNEDNVSRNIVYSEVLN